MKNLKLLFLLFVLSTFSCSVGNQALKKARLKIDEKEQWRYDLPKTSDELIRPTFPEIKSVTLKNGFKIFVVEDHRLPIAQVSLVFKHGSANDPYGQSGL